MYPFLRFPVRIISSGPKKKFGIAGFPRNVTNAKKQAKKMPKKGGCEKKETIAANGHRLRGSERGEDSVHKKKRRKKPERQVGVGVPGERSALAPIRRRLGKGPIWRKGNVPLPQ